MNLQKVFNRIFILLSLVMSLLGFVFGEEYAVKSWKPEPEEAFHSINWNEENVRKYHNLASTVAEKERAEIAEKEETMKPLFLRIEQNYHVKVEDLPNYEKSPPQY